MQKRYDSIFSFLMLVSAVAVVLAGWRVLSHSIASLEGDLPPIHTAKIQSEVPSSIPILCAGDLPGQGPKASAESSPEPEQELEMGTDHSYMPLDKPLAETLVGCCEKYGIPLHVALGLIEIESGFDENAVNSKTGCYGLMQLSPDWFPSGLSPAQNIEFGMEYLGKQLEKYGGLEAALTAYWAGHDNGSRGFAKAVLEAAEMWEQRGLDA